MPLPIPRKGESQSDFVSRCISYEKDASPEREDKQVQAMCFDRFREYRGGAKLAFFNEDNKYESAGSKLWRKQVLAFGVWKHPENRNVEFEISQDDALQIIKNFKAGIPKEAPVVLTHTDNPKAKIGIVKDFIVTSTGLDALMSIHDDEMNTKIQNDETAPGVSCWLDLEFMDKQTNERKGAVVKHVALVNHPYMEGLSGWQTASLSDVAEVEDTDDFTILVLSEKKIISEGEKMPKKDELIKSLKEDFNIDVEALLSESEEFKTLSDRIDKGELVAKEDVEAVLSEDTLTKVKELLKLSDETTKAEDIIKALMAKVAELSDTSSNVEKEITNLTQKLSAMEADKAVGALLSDGFALPTEKEYLTKIYLTTPDVFKELDETRRKGEKLVKLGEEGVAEGDRKEETKEEELDKEIDRHVEAAKDEGLIPKE